MKNVKPDIVLEFDDLYEFNDNNGNIKVDKGIFDIFVRDTYIKIQFTDNNEDIVFLYKMIDETDDYIEMEFLGEADEWD